MLLFLFLNEIALKKQEFYTHCFAIYYQLLLHCCNKHFLIIYIVCCSTDAILIEIYVGLYTILILALKKKGLTSAGNV